jgi:hypothetical protein
MSPETVMGEWEGLPIDYFRLAIDEEFLTIA